MMEGLGTSRMVAVAAGYSAAELDKLLEVVADQGINLDAYAANDAGVNLFAADPDRLKQVITDAGFFCQIVDVLSLEVGNRPGQVRSIMNSFKQHGIEVLSLFGMGIDTTGCIFIRVGNLEAAKAALAPGN